MDGIQMEPIGKYKADRNGSAKAAWRNMVDQDLDDVAFLADTDKAREARSRGETPVAVCSQRRALCLTALVFTVIFASALLVVYATPQPYCPCASESSLDAGQAPTDAAANEAAANKERIASNGQVFPWRGARLPTFVIPRHYSLWLHPNLTTGELRGEVSIDFRVDRDTQFVVLNVRDMNVTERALFKAGGTVGPKIARVLDYPQADQTYIEFKEKLRRKYNYTLSLRFITRLERNDKQRGFFLTGSHAHRCAVSRFWLTHARSAFPCLDEPHFRATFKLTIVRDRFHVSLTNMPIVATEEAGFYLGHRLLQDEFAVSPPMPPYMTSVTVCRLQRRAAPSPPTDSNTTEATTILPDDDDDSNLPPPEISLYSDQQAILDESGPLLEWVQKTIQMYSYELNTSYPLPKFDMVVVGGSNPYCEGWGLVVLAPATLSDTRTIARLLAQQWFGGLVSPRWWSSQWLLDALTSVLAERAPPAAGAPPSDDQDNLLFDHILPALRLDSSNLVRAVASPRLERADIESATDELSLHKGAAIVSMAIEAAGEAAGRAALARLLKDHRSASADARDLWRALERDGSEEAAHAHAWDGWCERAGHPLLYATPARGDVVLTQERFVMAAEPPEPDPPVINNLLTYDLRADLDQVFFEPENFTDASEEDLNSTTTAAPPTTTTKRSTTKSKQVVHKWVIPVTFVVGPLEEEVENVTKVWKNATEGVNGTWYDVVNDTRHKSRWAENVTHLIWMNDTEMTVPDLGKHKWVRYNVGARGLYRVAPQDPTEGETAEVAAARAAELYDSGAPTERALMLDDAFVLSRAGRLPASRAIAAANRRTTTILSEIPSGIITLPSTLYSAGLRAAQDAEIMTSVTTPIGAPSHSSSKDMKGVKHSYNKLCRLRSEWHWAPWRVVLAQLAWWRQLLATAASGPRLRALLAALNPPRPPPSTSHHQIWLSGALLSAGVEWGNAEMTSRALAMFDSWLEHNTTIDEMYQEAAFTAGVRTHGLPAWRACWRTLLASYAAPRPTHSHRALLAALASPADDWLFYKFAFTALSSESQRNREWKLWVTTLCASACKWRGAAGVWRVLRPRPVLPPAALQAAAKCLHQPQDYYLFKEYFGDQRGAAAALDIVALNAAWVPKADADLQRYFNAIDKLKDN